MNHSLLLFTSVLGGFLLGIFYFSSLWITVRQLPRTTMPIRLFVGSFIGRLLVALLGFYLIMQGQWERALLGLFGFLIARLILVRRWQPQGNVQSSSLDKP